MRSSCILNSRRGEQEENEEEHDEEEEKHLSKIYDLHLKGWGKPENESTKTSCAKSPGRGKKTVKHVEWASYTASRYWCYCTHACLHSARALLCNCMHTHFLAHSEPSSSDTS